MIYNNAIRSIRTIKSVTLKKTRLKCYNVVPPIQIFEKIGTAKSQIVVK